MALNKPTDRRQTLDCKCWIAATQGAPGVLARMAEISVSGAHIVVAAPTTVPDEFTLNFTEDGKVSRRCRVARRGDDGIGIIFLQKKFGKRAAVLRPSA